MKFEHRTKFSGVWYSAGVEVPTCADTPKTSVTVKEIERMTLSQLRDLCNENNISYEEEETKAKLKAKIIERLGL